ncbi:DUF721 domain-containing protein [Halocynthiibacter sp. C4]|uniref:DUF721 domain-containing protein n=1 Tax=Halocynthiibacter sp. C4 TaxID=2992758 RepID=UPI00237BB8A9|nr:DUF721 domain-containing protein [Halocynthiibacter sp. C4]MDE0591058.1 DUF721 domain-containing protein [Halocynthiibacter sp. C4]
MKPRPQSEKNTAPARRKRGFERTSSLLQKQIRKSAESRGFAVSRLITHWVEVVGEDIAKIARPVDVKYGRGSFGATLTLLTTGAQAPMLEMQKEQIRTRVNQVYGHAAISRVRITQTSPHGFADGKVTFQHAPKKTRVAPKPEQFDQAAKASASIQNDDLRTALANLGAKILSRKNN